MSNDGFGIGVTITMAAVGITLAIGSELQALTNAIEVHAYVTAQCTEEMGRTRYDERALVFPDVIELEVVELLAEWER